MNNSIQEIVEELKKAHSNAANEDFCLPDNANKERVIKSVRSLPPLTEEHIGYLNSHGFRTGSTVYGDISEAKDVDWVVNLPPFYFSGHAAGVEDSEAYWDERCMDPIYAHYDGVLFNIICMNDYSGLFNAWKQTTDTMEFLYHASSAGKVMKEKWQRVRLFRALLDIYWPVQPTSYPLAKESALLQQVCTICGREAINFTCKAAKDHYLSTAVCERCEPLPR